MYGRSQGGRDAGKGGRDGRGKAGRSKEGRQRYESYSAHLRQSSRRETAGWVHCTPRLSCFATIYIYCYCCSRDCCCCCARDRCYCYYSSPSPPPLSLSSSRIPSKADHLPLSHPPPPPLVSLPAEERYIKEQKKRLRLWRARSTLRRKLLAREVGGACRRGYCYHGHYSDG